MRKAFLGVAIAALAVLSFGGQAVASPVQGPQQRTSGPYADSHWITYPESGGFVETTLVASQSTNSGTLYIDHLVFTDTGAIETTVDVTSGFSLSVDTATLSSASLSATNLPTTVCAFDTNGNPVGDCTAGSPVSVEVAWTGFGPITHSVSLEKRTVGGHVLIVHANGKMRLAAATGSYGGLALGDSDHAHIGTANTVQIKR